jgi:hypothetical protein
MNTRARQWRPPAGDAINAVVILLQITSTLSLSHATR